MERFYRNGVLATRMNNSFPTKTFVNHFSIATGYFQGKKEKKIEIILPIVGIKFLFLQVYIHKIMV